MNSSTVRIFRIGKKEDGSGNIGVLGTMDFPKVTVPLATGHFENRSQASVSYTSVVSRTIRRL